MGFGLRDGEPVSTSTARQLRLAGVFDERATRLPGVWRRKLVADVFELDQSSAGDRLGERPAVGGRKQRIGRTVQHERREPFEPAQPRIYGTVAIE